MRGQREERGMMEIRFLVCLLEIRAQRANIKPPATCKTLSHSRSLLIQLLNLLINISHPATLRQRAHTV